jgi:hypothetical protein
MSISYTDVGTPVRHRTPTLLLWLMATNVGFAALILFAWRVVSLVVIDPVTWATWVPVYRGGDLLDLLRYPFVLLWLWPVAGVVGAWFSSKLGHRPFAYTCATLPVVVLTTIFCWYYLAPQDWH